jgi:hypothetical protein
MYKEQFIQMLRETFAGPSFTVSHKEVEEGHCAITVSYLKVAT